ncbi:single-stranded DNA-binding protein [Psychrobacter sanguinis]|uniref:single-stranded DNA-binding protein n=1 Tax=Psychrobacter sanguinis TaxID=861445 RepID=UPI0028A6C1E2|nr:single-stranded DNA-binding protein [Psychrobacter sanguinis]
MRGVNLVMLIGTLGKDPEVRSFSNGGGVTTFSIATSEQWTDKRTGEKREATEWHRISIFNNLGSQAAQRLKKGDVVYIEGSVKTRKYKDNAGQDRYATEIVADTFQLLSAPQPTINSDQAPEADVVGGGKAKVKPDDNSDFVPPPFGGSGKADVKLDDDSVFMPPPFGNSISRDESIENSKNSDTKPVAIDDEDIPF